MENTNDKSSQVQAAWEDAAARLKEAAAAWKNVARTAGAWWEEAADAAAKAAMAAEWEALAAARMVWDVTAKTWVWGGKDAAQVAENRAWEAKDVAEAAEAEARATDERTGITEELKAAVAASAKAEKAVQAAVALGKNTATKKAKLSPLLPKAVEDVAELSYQPPQGGDKRTIQPTKFKLKYTPPQKNASAELQRAKRAASERTRDEAKMPPKVEPLVLMAPATDDKKPEVYAVTPPPSVTASKAAATPEEEAAIGKQVGEGTGSEVTDYVESKRPIASVAAPPVLNAKEKGSYQARVLSESPEHRGTPIYLLESPDGKLYRAVPDSEEAAKMRAAGWHKLEVWHNSKRLLPKEAQASETEPKKLECPCCDGKGSHPTGKRIEWKMPDGSSEHDYSGPDEPCGICDNGYLPEDESEDEASIVCENGEEIDGEPTFLSLADARQLAKRQNRKTAVFNWFFPGQAIKEFYPELQHETVDWPNYNNSPMIEDAVPNNSEKWVSTDPGAIGIGRDGKPQVLDGAPLRLEDDIRGYMFGDEFYQQYGAVPGAALASLTSAKKEA